MSHEQVARIFSSISDSEAELAAKAIAIHACKEDLFTFARYILGYVDITKHTHQQVIDCLSANLHRKIIVMPRNTFKSSLACVAYPIWKLIRNPNETILLDSELFKNSKNFLREIKQHLSSGLMVNLFGEFEGPTWGTEEIIIKQRTKASPQASITVGSIGTEKTGQHYSTIISDDLNSPSNSDSPEKCQKVIDHFRYNLNILKPDGEYVLIGTRYSENDVIGFVLRDVLGLKELSEGKLGLAAKKSN